MWKQHYVKVKSQCENVYYFQILIMCKIIAHCHIMWIITHNGKKHISGYQCICLNVWKWKNVNMLQL